MLPLTKEELKSHQDAKVCYICGKRILKKLSKSTDSQKVRDHCHYTGKSRGFILIIKELGNKFEGKFECLGQNTEKYKTFSVPIEKQVTEIDKDGNESVVTISYKVKFIDSTRVMASSLSNLVHNQNLVHNLVHKKKEFTKLNVEIVIVFSNMKVLRII